MPMTKKASVSDLRDFDRAGKLSGKSMAEIEAAMEAGALLEYEASVFADPADYTALLLDGERVGYWPGY